MRFRRRKASPHRRKPGMKGDWVMGIHENCPVSVPNELCSDAEPANPFAFSLVDQQDLLDKEDKLTVVRTVGELCRSFSSAIINGSATNDQFLSLDLTWHEGIYVGGADAEVPVATVIELDPSRADDCALDTWMWLRHTHVIISAFLPKAMVNPVIVAGQFIDGSAIGEHIDLRVKRKLERGQELVYSAKMTFSQNIFTNAPLSTDITMIMAAKLSGHLRMYCKF